MAVETPNFCGQWGSTKENKHFIYLDPDRDENIAHIVTDMNKERSNKVRQLTDRLEKCLPTSRSSYVLWHLLKVLGP